MKLRATNSYCMGNDPKTAFTFCSSISQEIRRELSTMYSLLLVIPYRELLTFPAIGLHTLIILLRTMNTHYQVHNHKPLHLETKYLIQKSIEMLHWYNSFSGTLKSIVTNPDSSSYFNSTSSKSTVINLGRADE